MFNIETLSAKQLSETICQSDNKCINLFSNNDKLFMSGGYRCSLYSVDTHKQKNLKHKLSTN